MKCKEKLSIVFSILSVLWISYVFLGSLPYKFTGHPHTQNIFGTIGEWMKGILGESVGNGFTNYGAYVIGSMELIVSIILLICVFYYIVQLFGGWKDKKAPEFLLSIGGLGAFLLMSGAVFFHLFTPLGIEVNNDGGSLFKAAVSILIFGLILFILHFGSLRKKL